MRLFKRLDHTGLGTEQGEFAAKLAPDQDLSGVDHPCIQAFEPAPVEKHAVRVALDLFSRQKRKIQLRSQQIRSFLGTVEDPAADPARCGERAGLDRLGLHQYHAEAVLDRTDVRHGIRQDHFTGQLLVLGLADRLGKVVKGGIAKGKLHGHSLLVGSGVTICGSLPAYADKSCPMGAKNAGRTRSAFFGFFVFPKLDLG